MPEDAHARAMPAVTAEAAAFVASVRADGIPTPVVERGRVHMLDTIGLALAGSKAEASALMRDHVAALGAKGSAGVIGTALRTAPRFAALLNGTSMHADNFDDTAPQASPQRNGGIHASAAVLPAALALAEERGLGGDAVTAAYHVGVELACKLNHAIDARHYQRGYHVTGTLGTFGAAAAAAHLMGLDEAGIGRALAGAASRAAGVRANFGFMVEQTHAGLAAEAGIAAADLAARGMTGAPDILEAAAGWFDAGGGFDPEAICGRLGNPWAFVSPGMSIKPWPSGALTHPALTLLQNLMRAHGFRGDRVARVVVRTNRRIAATLRHPRPVTALQAKFSMPFCLAVMLAEGDAGIDVFTDAMVNRPDIRALMERIDHQTFESGEPDYTNVTTFLEIRLADGTVHRGRADFARGSNASSMGWDDACAKFLSCAAYSGWPEHRAREAAALIGEMEGLADIRPLMRLLTSD